MTEPTIKIQRDVSPRQRDFKVLINGEHRATFRSRKRYRQAGYDFQTADGEGIYPRKRRWLGSSVTKAEFTEAVQFALEENLIPTLAQIERSLLIDQARREDYARDQRVAEHRAQVRREVLRSALKRYLELGICDGEHHRMAERMLQEVA